MMNNSRNSSIFFKFVAVILSATSLTVVALNYDSDKIYSYSYETETTFNEAGSKKTTKVQQDVGVKISVEFDLSTVYKDAESQVFRLDVTSAKAASIQRPDVGQDLKSYLLLPVLFQINSDGVEHLYVSDKDSTFSRNFKKGIMALFQVQQKAIKRTEVDVSGECEVTYTLNGPDNIRRTKADCRNLEIANQFSNTNKALGVSLFAKSSQDYILKDSRIESVSGSQSVVMYLNIRSSLNGVVTSWQNLLYQSLRHGSVLSSSTVEAVQTIEKETGSRYSLTLLPSEEEIQQCGQACLSPQQVVGSLAEDLKAEKIASVPSAKAFVQVLQAFRESGKKSIAEVLTSPDNSQLVPQLIDVATAAQTEPAREALLELLDFEDAEAVEYPLRFLFAAAYSSHPTESLVTDLLSVLKKPVTNEKLQESLLLSLAAIIHTFCQIGDRCASPVVSEFKALVTASLSECQEEPCVLKNLRALGNAGLASTTRVILPFVESPQNSTISLTAILSLRRIQRRFITAEIQDALLRVFHQIRANYDSSVRLAALEIILNNFPSQQVIRDVLLTSLDQTNPEFSTYITRMLVDTASVNPTFSSQLAAVLQDPQLKNYNLLSQKGKSSVLTSYLAQMNDLNATYSLYFENTPQGVMKQSGMIVSLLGKTMREPFLKFGIYADGLETLIGETETKAEESENSPVIEPTAGMSFTLLDVLLTNVEFFRGMSGLMSAAWNAPSELTSALQGNLLLQDHSQRIHLANGLVLDTKVLGVLSLDLSGYISISFLWRTCEALIRNSGALYLQGTMRVNSALLDLGLVFSGEGQSNIDYTSNVDFSGNPLKLCMQMIRPDFEWTQKVQKFETLLKGKKHSSARSRKTKVNSEEYLLNKANSEECRQMLANL